ncbi:MAG: hypothetical protein H7329_10370 [Opitutaceae bacterium]|nr:hypothetical protein [Cytophagales bacterium]
MKKILLLFLVSSQVLLAQIPQAFNYQGIARDLSGNPLANKAIKVRLSILSESGTNQTTLYSESHNLSTNQFGLFALPVGKGTVISGIFAGIIWTDATKKLLKSEIDPDGNGYSLNVTSDLQSVPFALSAKTVETENQKLTLAGSLLSISQGNSVDLSTLTGNSQWSNNSVGINYNNRVGIGTSNPVTKLHIDGNFTGIERNPIELSNQSTSQDAICGIGLTVGGTDRAALQVFNNTYFPSTLPFWSGRTILGSNSPNGINLSASAGTANIEFAVGAPVNQETPVRMLISNNGNVGIGTLTPKTQLHVKGAVYLEDANQGMIMKSPNGGCWKVAVGDTGTLTSTSVTCP